MALLPRAPSPVESPVAIGTKVELDEQVTLLDRDLLTGGSPWRLLRLAGGSRRVLERWRGGGEVLAGEERFARTLVQQGLVHPHFVNQVDVDDVDVIIPVRDDVASLRVLLAQLVGFHVTVVDDGSLNHSMIEDCARQFDVSLVTLEENRGPGAARNAGVAATSRPMLWFLDADVTIDSPTDVVARLGAEISDPLVGAVAPRIRGGAGSSIRDRFERRFSPLDMGERGGLVVPGAAVGYVPSACLLVRRASFGEGFDEDLRCGEDVDLIWRLVDQGWLVRYDASVTVIHRARGTWRHWWNQRVGYGESASDLAARHPDRLAPIRLDAWTTIAWGAALAGRPGWSAQIVRAARANFHSRVADSTEDPSRVTREVVARNMVRTGAPLARAIVRTFGLVVLASALHPRLRRRALVLFTVGTAWRWRTTRLHVSDVPLAIADDVAYAVGVYRGAWRTKTLGALKPHFTKSSIGLRDVLGLRTTSTDA